MVVRIGIVWWLAFLISSHCRAAQVLILGAGPQHDGIYTHAEQAARFYGLDVVKLKDFPDLSNRDEFSKLLTTRTAGVVATESAIAGKPTKRLLSLLQGQSKAAVPLLVIYTSARNYHKFNSGPNCTELTHAADNWNLTFPESSYARELMSLSLPFHGSLPCQLTSPEGHSTVTLISATAKGMTLPVLVAHTVDGYLQFGLSGLLPTPVENVRHRSLTNTFAALSPYLVFTKYAAGHFAWQPVRTVANLAIDDPWLTPRYGSVDYAALTDQMDRHRFHTTIGFIPWNYDRSDPAVVRLFRTRPHQWSIAIHGNNHDHREFGSYDRHSYQTQKWNAKQAILRMARFTQETGIPYDRVMLFPHAVAPAETFRLLKSYNYLGTTNSENVPSDVARPADEMFYLRPYTLRYKNFASIRRYSAEVPVPFDEIAINAFLGSPLLFYGHEQMFYKRIGAFNQVADTVNRLAPGTEWSSLGDCLRYLYLHRVRDDGDYDVQAFSPSIRLTNNGNRSKTFYVSKAEDFEPAVKGVTVGGRPVAFKASRDELSIQLAIPPHGSADLEITYENDLQSAPLDVSRYSLRIQILRRLSDLRDISLSVSPWGRVITTGYRLFEKTSPVPVELVGLTTFPLGALVFIVYTRRRRKKYVPTSGHT